VKALTVAAGAVALCSAVLIPTKATADDRGPEPQLVLHYDFYDVQDGVVADGSGNGHRGTIVDGSIVSGRRKPALQLAGSGRLSSDSLSRGVEFAGRAMTVGAMCKPTSPDGVIASMGDSTNGFSLSLRGGVPHFAVTAKGVLHEVIAPEPVDLDQWVHIAGVIEENGGLSLLLNAWSVAESPEPSFLAATPSGPFAVGADAGTPVGPYAVPMHWQGLIEDVRLYWGAIKRQTHGDLLGDWANRPGCGCRK
jgi:hypothetical protein